MRRIQGYLGRRDILKIVGMGGVGLAAATAGGVLWNGQGVDRQAAKAQPKPQPVSPDAAFQRLMEGNKRFVQGQRKYPDQARSRLQETAAGQYPFATILTCADSRVPAEIVFDQGIGDIFVVRVAGNVVNPEVIGSLEYATSVVGAQLLMIMGHERCGAVTEAVKGSVLPANIATFVNDVKPAIERVKNKPGDLIDNTVVANVQMQIELLKQKSTIVTQLIQQGKLKLVGARYDLDTGEVTIVA